MLLNYHELTMNESKDSPQRRLQHRVICSIMAAAIAYSVVVSGILLTIEPFETLFPGGTLCYKAITRDYVTSAGFGRRFRKEVLEAFPEEGDDVEGISLKTRKQMIEDKFYHVYLDNPGDIWGTYSRWMGGILVSDDTEKANYCDPHFEKNPGIERVKELNKDEPSNQKKASDLFYEAIYQTVTLPSVDSLAIKFPFSNGFLSGLVLSYKIIPEMRQLAAEKGEDGNSPVVISQCNEEEQTCTHYIPLSKGIDFYAGQPLTEEYEKLLGAKPFNIFEEMKGGLYVLFPSLKPAQPASSSTSEL